MRLLLLALVFLIGCGTDEASKPKAYQAVALTSPVPETSYSLVPGVTITCGAQTCIATFVAGTENCPLTSMLLQGIGRSEYIEDYFIRQGEPHRLEFPVVQNPRLLYYCHGANR